MSDKEVLNTNGAIVTARVDATLKKAAEELFDDLGMTLSSAINIFLRQSVRSGKIPFSIRKNFPAAQPLVDELKQNEKWKQKSQAFERDMDRMRTLTNLC